jgi:hypothetical protein
VASAKNWSSLGGVGFTPIAGAPVIENNNVLRPHRPGRRWERRHVDVWRYAPQCFGIQRRLGASMEYDAQTNTLELEGHRNLRNDREPRPCH